MKINPNLLDNCLFFGNGGRFFWGRGPFREYESEPDEAAFYENDFALSVARPWKVATELREVTTEDFEVAEPPTVRWRSPEQETFKMVFRRVRQEVLKGNVTKMVPVLTQSGTLVEGSMMALFPRLVGVESGLFAYGGQSGGRGFAGVTPEILADVKGGRMITMALAGTASPKRMETFSTDAKESLEQALVADWMAERLTRLGVVRSEERDILEAGGLRHLVTRFRVDEAAGNLDAWIRLLHPTPAVGCLPEGAAAMAWLRQCREQLNVPEAFAAPFGFRNETGETTVVVRIRGVFWDGSEIRLPSGCGVVRGSIFDHEWRELAMKRQSTRQTLGL